MSNTNYESNYGSGATGSHPTMAGNMLDPNIRSDGQMTGGPGVGGTSERHVREEGAEHIRQNPETTSSSVGGGLGSASGLETSSGLGSSSNLGSSSGVGSSTGGGLSSFGEGGVSGTGSSYNSSSNDRSLGSETGQTTSSSSGGVIGSALSYLGLGGKSGEQQSGVTGQDSTSSYTSGTGSTGLGGSSSYEPQSSSYGQSTTSSREPQYESTSGSGYGSSAAGTALGGAGLAGAASGLGSERETSSYGGQSGDRSYGGESTGLAGTSSTLGSERDTSSYGGQSGDRSYGGETGSDTLGGSSQRGSTRDEVASRTPTDNNVTTGSDPLDSAAPPDTDTAGTGVSKQSHEAKLHDKHASTRENVDAIPTAGGERLGAKHWGESKIVPENPKPQAEAGVSSNSSHFSNEVRDNTNRNTGAHSATPTGTGAHGKESVADKMKDKLHLGGSLGSSEAE